MIVPPPGARVYLATTPCDMRKGFDGLAAQVQTVLQADPFSGALFVFRKRCSGALYGACGVYSHGMS